MRMQVSGRQSKDPGSPTLSVTLPPPGGPRCSLAQPRRAAAGPRSSQSPVPPLSRRQRWAPTPPCRRKRRMGVSGQEKIGFNSLRTQGQYWSVRESGLTDSHLVISLLSSSALRLLLLNPSDTTSESLRAMLWQLTFEMMNHRVKLSVFYQSHNGFLEQHIKASYFQKSSIKTTIMHSITMTTRPGGTLCACCQSRYLTKSE